MAQLVLPLVDNWVYFTSSSHFLACCERLEVQPCIIDKSLPQYVHLALACFVTLSTLFKVFPNLQLFPPHRVTDHCRLGRSQHYPAPTLTGDYPCLAITSHRRRPIVLNIILVVILDL